MPTLFCFSVLFHM